MADSLRGHFLLDPNVVFLNHGSFGACPRPVFEVWQQWQRELEREPVRFFSKRADGLMAEARAQLAGYLGAPATDIQYFPNPTAAMNLVARSLPLRPGDEILATDHEYGAMDRLWMFIAEKTGARYVRQPIPLPVTTSEAFVDALWAGVTERTRLIFTSHITSATALIFPVEEICRRARAAGLLCFIDGAHAPSQIRLNLSELGADVYTGACHKWLCAPKGTAFLYATPDVQEWLEPLIVSFGWGETYATPASRFLGYTNWQGTRDLSAFLAVPAAIDFQHEHGWDTQRRRCRTLVQETRRRLHTLTGLEPICPESPAWFSQMATVRLPAADLEALKDRLYDDYRIQVPIASWNGQPILRVSCQAYNDQSDADALIDALARLLPRGDAVGAEHRKKEPYAHGGRCYAGIHAG